MSLIATTPQEINALLSTPLNRLNLQITGSSLEKHIIVIYNELKAKGIQFMPECYLSDEWGCPHLTPVIGIPFYLVDEVLKEFEKKYTNIEAETDEEILMYLRHEAGHALNYAYEVYKLSEWETIFGPFSFPYIDIYHNIPNHPSFVTYLPNWYAQKHPDEDFAETFAVWLDTSSNWRQKYSGTRALEKLLYVDRICSTTFTTQPHITSGYRDNPINELTLTLSQWYADQNETNDDKIK